MWFASCVLISLAWKIKKKKKKKTTEFSTKIMEPALVHKYSVPVIEPVERS